jgi:hypothetical protein
LEDQEVRFSRRLAVVLVGLLVVTIAGPTTGAQPQVAPKIMLVDTAGFERVAEVVTAKGAVIDTFTDGSATVKVIGTPGSTVTIKRSKDAKGADRVDIGMSTTRPKDLADVERYKNSGRSVIEDLVALGMPRADAIAQFGDMDTMDGSNPYASAAGTKTASAEALPPVDMTAASAPSSTVPYDTQCASLSYDSGKITGYGCSTIYWVGVSGITWYFNSKFKLSARSNDTSWWRPQRLFSAGWSLQWAPYNVLHDWEPSGTINRSNCDNLSLGLSAFGFGISVGGPVCPTKIGPWRLTTRENGSLWQGVEQGTQYETAIGVQAMKNPGEAQVSYQSWYSLTWGPWG